MPPGAARRRRGQRTGRGALRAAVPVAAAVAIGAVVSALTFAAISDAVTVRSLRPKPPSADGDAAELAKEIGRLESLKRRLSKKVPRFAARGHWLMIDSGANRLYLMKGERVVREAVCSTGSGMRLADPDSDRKWVFNTPRGEFRVRRKKVDPVWIKPDWAFIEEGLPVPDSYRERVDRESLGDYALDLGDGYLIHGTLYKRTLGLSVTHGCIRLGDEDLEAVFRSVGVGTRVVII